MEPQTLIGRVTETATAHLDRDSIINFAKSWDPQSMHVDPIQAEAGFFGGLIASGWHVLCTGMRLLVEADPFDGRQLIGVTVRDVRFHRPVKPGTEIYVRAEVIDAEAADIPGAIYAEVSLSTLDRDSGKTLVTQSCRLLLPAP